MHKIHDLIIWNKAMNLVTEVYESTANFPSEEKFGLTSQIRRSAVSIPSNIAEGAGRTSSKEFNQFIGIANGSAYELQTQIMLSKRLNYLNEETAEKLLLQIEEIQKMAYSFQKKLTLQ